MSCFGWTSQGCEIFARHVEVYSARVLFMLELSHFSVLVEN